MTQTMLLLGKLAIKYLENPWGNIFIAVLPDPYMVVANTTL
jgi:hypothetical protein